MYIFFLESENLNYFAPDATPTPSLLHCLDVLIQNRKKHQITSIVFISDFIKCKKWTTSYMSLRKVMLK